MANAKTQNLTAQQRAQLFGASTRQHFQMIGKKTVTGGAQMVEFEIPKARILHNVKLLVEAKVIVKGSGSAPVASAVAPYDLFRLITVNYNNGFKPIMVSGSELALANMLYTNPDMVRAREDGSSLCKCPSALSASSEGVTNDIKFMLDIPIGLNYRDPTAMVMVQNAETSVTVNLDIGYANTIIGQASGFTCDFGTINISAMATTYSIPADSRCWPDFSVLKILNSNNYGIVNGQNYIKLPVGMIYRKMILRFEDENGQPMTLEDITSNIEILLNTADTPYSVSPAMLREIDKFQAGVEFPEGCYYFSWDFQGQNGYGGSRDLMDTERVTEMAVRFTSGKSGKLTVIGEKISRLITA